MPKCKRFKGSSGGIQSTFRVKVGPGLGLEQVAQGFIHSKTETLEGQKWHSLPKLPAPLPHCLHRETGSLYTQPELLLRQLLPFLHPRCILHCYEETTSISLMTPHRYWGAVPEAVPEAVLSPGWPSPDWGTHQTSTRLLVCPYLSLLGPQTGYIPRCGLMRVVYRRIIPSLHWLCSSSYRPELFLIAHTKKYWSSVIKLQSLYRASKWTSAVK